MKFLVAISRIFVGGLFIFSGFIKAVDPLGTSYKMGEYFAEFGMEFMEPLGVPFAVFMIVLELVLGVTLLLGYFPKLTIWSLILIIIFFTFLTGYTTFTGRVTDCGCFGDFLKLEPKESFIKDIVLSVLIFIIYFGLKHVKPLFSSKVNAGLTITTLVASLGFCFSNYVFDLPVFDFRPYHLGSHIPEKMIPVQEDSTDFFFIYKNEETQEEKEFKISNLPKAPWQFVDRREKVIIPGIPAKIANFYVSNEDGLEISDDLLNDENYSFWVVAYDLKKTNVKAFNEKINPLAEKAESAGYKLFAITSSESENFRHENQTAFPFYGGDPTFLKTIVRSNPGVLIVKNGTVIAKWHHRKLPEFEAIKTNYLK